VALVGYAIASRRSVTISQSLRREERRGDREGEKRGAGPEHIAAREPKSSPEGERGRGGEGRRKV
jgi:hypothetical protein